MSSLYAGVLLTLQINSSVSCPSKLLSSKHPAVTAAATTIVTSSSEVLKLFPGFSFGDSGVPQSYPQAKAEDKKKDPNAGFSFGGSSVTSFAQIQDKKIDTADDKKLYGFETALADSWECKSWYQRIKKKGVRKSEEATKPMAAVGSEKGFNFAPAAIASATTSSGEFAFGSSAAGPKPISGKGMYNPWLINGINIRNKSK